MEICDTRRNKRAIVIMEKYKLIELLILPKIFISRKEIIFMNQFIEINSKKCNIYSYGEGIITIVLLSGSGVTFPSFEYISLAKALGETYRFVGIEKLGYGYSDMAEGNRHVDTIINEYQSILQKLKINTPVILAAHSMGFLEALRWAQIYPSQICGILGIDPATPECYEDFNIEEAVKGLINLSENESLKKSSADSIISQLPKEACITQEKEKELKMLAYRNLANQNWISEAQNLKNAIKLIKENNAYIQVPMAFFLSNGEGTTIKKDIWINHALNYLNHINIAQYEIFEYPHNLYKFVYQNIVKSSREFISKYV